MHLQALFLLVLIDYLMAYKLGIEMKQKTSFFEFIGMLSFVIIPPVGMYVLVKFNKHNNNRSMKVFYYVFILFAALYWMGLIKMGDNSFFSILISNLCLWFSLLVFMIDKQHSNNIVLNVLGTIFPVLTSLLLFMYSSAYTNTLGNSICGGYNFYIMFSTVAFIVIQFLSSSGVCNYPYIFKGLNINNNVDLEWTIMKITAFFPLLLLLPFLNEKLPNVINYIFCF